jgi:peptidoglycan hydrolase CwlO-like protein
MKKHAILFFMFFLLLFSQASFSQDFSSVDNDLQILESLISDTLANTQEQQQQLSDLKDRLNESGNLIDSYGITITEQENLLAELRSQLGAMSETFRTQSALSARLERSSKFWRTFTLIAVPVTALISGGVVWAIMQ